MGLFDFIPKAVAGAKKTAGTMAANAAEARRNNTTFDINTGKHSPIVRSIEGEDVVRQDLDPMDPENEPYILDGKPVDPVLMDEFMQQWGSVTGINAREGGPQPKDFDPALRQFLRAKTGYREPVSKWLGEPRRDINALPPEKPSGSLLD